HLDSAVSELARVASRRFIFTSWICENGDIYDGHESIGGSQFLHRAFSHEFIIDTIRRCGAGRVVAIEARVIAPANWAYVVDLGPAASSWPPPRVAPFYGLVEGMQAHQVEALGRRARAARIRRARSSERQGRLR